MKITKLLVLGLALTLTACNGGAKEPDPKPIDMNRVLDTILNFGENYKLTVEETFDFYGHGYPETRIETTYTSREGLSYCTSSHTISNTLMSFEEYKNFVLYCVGEESASDDEIEEYMEVVNEYYGYVHTVEGDKHRIYLHEEELPEYMTFNIATPYIYERYVPSRLNTQTGRYLKTTSFIRNSITETVDPAFSLNFINRAKPHLKWDETNRCYNYDINYTKEDKFYGTNRLKQLKVVVDENNKLKDIEYVRDESTVGCQETVYGKVTVEVGGQKVVSPVEASLLPCEHNEYVFSQATYDGEYYHFQECKHCEDVKVDTIEKCTFDEKGCCTGCNYQPIDVVVLLESDDQIPLVEALINPISNIFYFLLPAIDATVVGSEDPNEITIDNDSYVSYPSNYDFYSTYVYEYNGLMFAIEETGPSDDWTITRYVLIIGCTFKDNVVKGGTLTTYITNEPPVPTK